MSRSATNPTTYFARLDFRHHRIPFGIRRADRLAHLYAIGKTGTGKSTLLETLIRQDLANGEGLALLDPHGDLVERVAAHVPESRREDLVDFDVPDPNQPLGYNPLKRVPAGRRPLAASGLLEVFKKLWDDAWGPRMEHILRNALLALLDQPQATLPDILRLFQDQAFRRQVTDRVRNPMVREFWRTEYENYAYRMRADAIAPIQNKAGAFLADPTLYRLLTRPEHDLNLRRILDDGKILLINLAKGQLGEDSSGLLGGLLVTTLALAAFSRADTPEGQRRRFHLYIDEFQDFTTLTVANMTAELRKYGLALVLANQYLHQLEPAIRYAVLGNAGTLIAFRVGGQDAPFLAREFRPTFEAEDLVALPNYRIYLKLMIDGAPSRPFSAVTMPPDAIPDPAA